MAKQFDYEAILETFRDLQEQANQANLERYQDILRTVKQGRKRVRGLYGDINDLIEGLGESEFGRIEQGRQQAQAAHEQDLINRGLGNTTIRASVMRGVEDDAARARRELTEQIGRQRASALQARADSEERFSNLLASMIERRSDVGPDLGMFAGLLQQLGAAQAAQQATEGPLFTGLSANARAGRDAFGQPFEFFGGGSSSGGGGSSLTDLLRSLGGGGGGGSGPQIYRGAAESAASSLPAILRGSGSAGVNMPRFPEGANVFLGDRGFVVPGGTDTSNLIPANRTESQEAASAGNDTQAAADSDTKKKPRDLTGLTWVAREIKGY